MKEPIGNKRYLKLYNETATNRVMEILFKFPEKEFSLTDLAKEAGVRKANIGKILDKLQKYEIIQITKLSKIWRIKANQQNFYFIGNKIIYNLHSIYKTDLIDFLDKYFKNAKAIILFGSYRKGDDISTSDIDIAIETENIDIYKTLELKELNEYEKILNNKKIQIHLFNRKSIDINVFNNIANGIVLSGFLEVRP